MFLRQYTRKKAGKVHRYWALVESMRTEEGPRQRVVAPLGELNHSQQRRWQRMLDQRPGFRRRVAGALAVAAVEAG